MSVGAGNAVLAWARAITAAAVNGAASASKTRKASSTATSLSWAACCRIFKYSFVPRRSSRLSRNRS